MIPGTAMHAEDLPSEGLAARESSEAAAFRMDADAALAVQAALSLFVAVALTVIWAVARGGSFWPKWIYLGVGVPLGLHLAVQTGVRLAHGRVRELSVHALLSAVLAITLVAIWAMTAHHAFWPMWPIVGLALVLAAHALALAVWRRFAAPPDRVLVQRVDELTRTRRGALDVQAAELRRIERDLHDGAQARLVALTMQLGRAEARLADRPEEAALVRQARGEAGVAIGELRDLARGILPPVLADRGLAAAVQALGERTAIPVTTESQLALRPSPVLENAAYFVVAEALTNVAKHAGPGATAHVALTLAGDRLTVAISDDGAGGADPVGGGLNGLRQRVEALDGDLVIAAAEGGGTRITAVLPCVS